MRRLGAAAVAIVCGIELVIVVVIGGAGASAFFGWEGAIVVAAVGLAVFETARRRGWAAHRPLRATWKE